MQTTMSRIFEGERQAPAIAVALAAAALALTGLTLAFSAPCPACLRHVVAWAIGFPVALAAWLAAIAGAQALVVRRLLIVCGLTFAVAAFFGLRDTGAEWGAWTVTCGGGDCGATPWHFLFVPFAGWSALLALVLVAVSFWGAFRPIPGAPPAQPNTRSGWL